MKLHRYPVSSTIVVLGLLLAPYSNPSESPVPESLDRNCASFHDPGVSSPDDSPISVLCQITQGQDPFELASHVSGQERLPKDRPVCQRVFFYWATHGDQYQVGLVELSRCRQQSGVLLVPSLRFLHLLTP